MLPFSCGQSFRIVFKSRLMADGTSNIQPFLVNKVARAGSDASIVIAHLLIVRLPRLGLSRNLYRNGRSDRLVYPLPRGRARFVGKLSALQPKIVERIRAMVRRKEKNRQAARGGPSLLHSLPRRPH